MRICFIGDVVGFPGRQVLQQHLPALKERIQPDLTIVNGENAAHGKGITRRIYHQLLDFGADYIRRSWDAASESRRWAAGGSAWSMSAAKCLWIT